MLSQTYRDSWSKLTRMFAEFLYRQGKTRNTVLVYANHAQRFEAWLNSRASHIARASPDDLATYLNAMSEDGVTRGERTNRRSALFHFYMYALRKLTDDEPRDYGTPPSEPLAQPHQIAQD